MQAKQESASVMPVVNKKITPKRKIPYYVWSILFLLGTLGIIEWLVRIEVISKIIMPAPTAVAVGLVTVVTTPNFMTHLGVTLYEVFAGFLIGVIGGMVLGVFLGLIPAMNKILYPYIVFFQGLPKIVLAPVFVTWFGFDTLSKIVMAITVSFFPVFINTILGITNIEKQPLSLMASYNATPRQVFFKLRLPTALPTIFAGIKTSLTFALIGAIIGEFVGAKYGLGYLIQQYNFLLKTDLAFALILITGIVGVVLYIGIDWISRKVVHWKDHDILL
jgi:NitT/TauT family transport system permease protein